MVPFTSKSLKKSRQSEYDLRQMTRLVYRIKKNSISELGDNDFRDFDFGTVHKFILFISLVLSFRSFAYII